MKNCLKYCWSSKNQNNVQSSIELYHWLRKTLATRKSTKCLVSEWGKPNSYTIQLLLQPIGCLASLAVVHQEYHYWWTEASGLVVTTIVESGAHICTHPVSISIVFEWIIYIRWNISPMIFTFKCFIHFSVFWVASENGLAGEMDNNETH